MFDNQYDEAAKLFKKIIVTQPTNKAARIRLQECIENHPELAGDYSDVNDSILYTSGKTGARHEKDVVYTGEDFGEGIENLEDAMKKTETSSAYDSNKEGHHSRHVHEDVDAKEIYDRAISAMFQNNYKDAARMFKQVLSMKPSYKAAKIRLKECLEAMDNA